MAVDSNADWGQDTKRIRNYLGNHPEKLEGCSDLFVDYGWNWESALDYYGIGRNPMEEFGKGSRECLIIGSTGYANKRDELQRRYELVDKITPTVFLLRSREKSAPRFLL